MNLASLISEYERLLREAKLRCEKICMGRENCFKKCYSREKRDIQLAIEQKYGVTVEVIT